ncbi:synaptobrevin VAMP [Tubulinosema ratisbonensis]|uniref:Synaptobrevin VAMP n=1 Tax=Tubulinosema ratisbonensis TaxID=291195 RepID=A0A437AN60_9MICR|nr:synaptobrevin VAMP [Tubulinosema ratisbonensis]
MTILYSQIQLKNDLYILTGSVSQHGTSLQNNQSIFRELQSVITQIPNKSPNFYRFKCSESQYLFYIKIENSFIYSAITDVTNTQSTILNFFANIEAIFKKVYTPGKKNFSFFNDSIKESTDKFNKDSKYLEMGADLEKTKGMYADSLNLLLQRGENLKTINLLAEKLKFASEELKKNSRQMYLDTFVSKYKFIIGIVVLLFLFFYFLMK